MFFSKPTSEQAIALAAIFHCCELVSQLANTGEASSEDMATCMGALLNRILIHCRSSCLLYTSDAADE